MDYKREIGGVIKEFDVSSEESRKKAYNKCIEYAKEKFKSGKDFNSFIGQAAEMLGQVAVRKDVIAESVLASGGEKLNLVYTPQTGPVLTGNKTGLSYLSNLLANLAGSKEPGMHTHLFADQFPMTGQTYPLTVYIEDDKWFLEVAQKSEQAEKAPAAQFPRRDIEPDEIIAFSVLGALPPMLPVVAGNIYKVLSCEKYKDQDVLQKFISEKSDRLFVFEFDSAEGAAKQMALDLDDPAVLFITRREIKKLV